VKVKLQRLRVNQDRQIRYFVIPILFAPEVLEYPTIGEGFVFYYYASGVRYQPRINSHEIWYRNAAEVNNALRAADYLIVTNPGRLFERDPEPDANALLCTMANLAIAKRGALGYMPLNYTAYQVQTVIRGTGIWGRKLQSGWPENGYLLLVGESEIVPAFTIFIGTDEYPIIDYPYADIEGDELPELRVGRIIGQTASELMDPIRTSLNVHSGGGSYDGSDALLVSGPEGPWSEGIIPNVEGARPDLRNEGVAFEIVHTEYCTTRRTMLEEALRIKGPGSGGTRGDADLSSFTLPKLTAWMLESEGRLVVPPGATVIRFHDTEGRLRRLPDPMLLDNINEAYSIAERVQIPPRGGDYGRYTYFPDGNDSGRQTNWYVERRRSETIKSNSYTKDLILFSGHGDPGGWAASLTEWGGSGSEIEPISFGGTNPIVIAFSCATGFYNLYDAAAGGDISIAKAFLRNGAAAYIGATRTSGAGACDEMTNNGWWVYWSKDSRIGDAFYNFRRDKIRRADFYGFVHEYNLYGDPKFSRR
jgi:hypothetical protein